MKNIKSQFQETRWDYGLSEICFFDSKDQASIKGKYEIKANVLLKNALQPRFIAHYHTPFEILRY